MILDLEVQNGETEGAILGRYRVPLQDWRDAKITSISCEAVTLLVEDTYRPSGEITISVEGTCKALPFRAICHASVVRVTQNAELGAYLEVSAYARRWEIKRSELPSVV